MAWLVGLNDRLFGCCELADSCAQLADACAAVITAKQQALRVPVLCRDSQCLTGWIPYLKIAVPSLVSAADCYPSSDHTHADMSAAYAI